MNKRKAILGLATLTMSSVFYSQDVKMIEPVLNVGEETLKISQNNNDDVAIVAKNLNLRTSPSIEKDNILLSMKAGSKVNIISNDGEWTKVKFGNKEGFASTMYLKELGLNAKTGVLKRVKVNTASLNVRAGASTQYKIIGSVKRDEILEVYASNSDWIKIKYKDKDGYVSSKYVIDVPEETNALNKDMEIYGTKNLNVRSGPGNNYSIKGKLVEGDKIKILSIDNGWAKFNYKNTEAYVSVKYLKEVNNVENIPSQDTSKEVNKEMLVTVSKTTLRNGEGTKYSIAGTLKQGDTVFVKREMSSGWSEVLYNNKIVYVLTSHLTDKVTKPSVSEQEKNLESFKQEVLNLVNIEREKEGLCLLTMDSTLSNVAQLKSQDMIDNNYFEHNSPVYGTPFEMMKSFGVKYRIAGENIAMGHSTPKEVVRGWMNSEGHRKNIMNPRFTHLGMGVARAESGRIYWTQMFTGQQ